MFKFSTMSKSEMPSIALTGEQQLLLGLEGYSPQTMIAKLVLPVHKPVKTKKVNSFSYRFTKKMCLAVKVVLPGVTPHQDEYGNFDELWSTLSKSEMPSITLTREQLTREQRILLGLKGYLPQTMIAKLVLPVYEPVKKLNYFSYPFTKKMCLAVKVVLPGVTPPRDENQTDSLSDLQLMRLLDELVSSVTNLRDACGQTDLRDASSQTEAECDRRSAVDNTQVFLSVDSWDDPTSVGVFPFGMGFVDRDQLMNNAIKPTVQHVVRIDDIKTGETHAAFFGANNTVTGEVNI